MWRCADRAANIAAIVPCIRITANPPCLPFSPLPTVNPDNQRLRQTASDHHLFGFKHPGSHAEVADQVTVGIDGCQVPVESAIGYFGNHCK